MLYLMLGLGALFAGVVLALVAIGSLTTERHQIGRSFAAIEAIQSAPSAMRKEVDRPFADRAVVPLLEGLSRTGQRISGRGTAERLRGKLEYAGNPAGWDVDRVLAVKTLGLIAGASVGFLVPLALGVGALIWIVAAVGMAALGYFVPDLVLYQVAYDRSHKMRRELPNAIDLLTISVEAGLAFDAGMSQVARNTEGPLAEELFRVLQEMQIGMGRAEAMRALAERTQLTELKAFVSAMVQADSFGIPIANVLRVQSSEIRVKRRQWAEEIAQKVPVKILFPLIFLVMPSLFVVVLGPAVLQMMDFFR